MPGFIHVAASEKIAPPLSWADTCGIRINGVGTLAYDPCAVPVNITALQQSTVGRIAKNVLALEGNLGVLTVVPVDTPDVFGLNQETHIPGFVLEKAPPKKTSFMGIFPHHEVRLVLTPNVKLKIEESYKIDDRRSRPTDVTFYQYSPIDGVYTEVSVITPVKSLNLRVELSEHFELVRKYNIQEELRELNIPGTVSERHFRSPECLKMHNLFPDFDEEQVHANIGVCKAFEPSYRAFYEELNGIPLDELFRDFKDFPGPSQDSKEKLSQRE